MLNKCSTVKPNPPTKLTDKECSAELFLCHPELLQAADQDLNKNLSSF